MNKLKILFVIAALIIGGGNAAWAGTKTVYLDPGVWDKDGAWFALYMFDDTGKSKTEAWVSFALNSIKALYEASFDDTYKSMILVRMNASKDVLEWASMDNQTDDIPAPVVNGMTYTITSFTGGYGGSDNSSYTLSGNTVFIYNLAAEAAGIDKYLCSGNYYGSNAVVGTGGFPLKLVVNSKTAYKICTSAIYYKDADRYIHRNEKEGEETQVFMDSGSSTDWTFEVVSGSTGVFKIKTGEDVYLQKNASSTYVIASTDPNNANAQWKIQTEQDVIDGLAGATKASSKNATALIKNNYFAYGADSGTPNMVVKKDATLSVSTFWQGESFTNVAGDVNRHDSNVAAEQYRKTFNNYQVIAVPNGIYHMTAKVLFRTGTYESVTYDAIPYIYATSGDNTVTCNAKPKGDLGTDDISHAAQALMNDDYLLDGVDIIVSNGSLQVGIKSDANVDWCVFDDFQLLYYGPNSVGNVSVALPEGGDMVANTWYYVDADGICNVSATTPANIVYTATGTDLVTDVSASLPVNVAGRFYVKSSSDNNLAVGSKICDNFSYHFLRTSDYKYLSRGGTYNTQAIADDYGIPVRVAYENNNINFMFVDNWLHLYDASSGNIFTDANTHINFALEPTDGGYFIINKNTRESSTYDYKLYIDSNDGYYVKASNSNSTKWVLEDANTAAHKNRMQSIKDAQAAGAATSAGIDGCSTQEALATRLSIYDATPISITGTGGTIQESYQEGATSETGNELAIFTEETVSGLTPGLYCLSVKAFERITWDNNVNDAGGASGLTYVYANDQKVKLYSLFDYPNGTAYTDNNDGDPENITYGGQYYPNTLTSAQQAFNADKYVNKVYVWVTDEGSGTGSIRFGIKKPHRYGNDNARGAWVCYNNFSLTNYTPYAVTINQLETFTPENKFANVTLNRTLNEGKWNTFCVPFAISNAELATAFGTGTNVAVYSEVADVDGSNSIVYFNLMPEPAVTANVPVLLKPTEVSGTGSYSFSDRTIVALPDGGAKVAGTAHYDFVGTYTPTTYVTTGNYYLWNDNNIYRSESNEGTYVNGTRAYIQKRAGYAGARIVNFSIEDEASGISQIEADPRIANATYNLKGQKVSGKMGKGIYVVDGKKVVIK